LLQQEPIQLDQEMDLMQEMMQAPSMMGALKVEQH